MKTALFVDGGSLIDERISGTGHVALRIIKFLSENDIFLRNYSLTVVIPFNKVSRLRKHGFNKNVRIKKVYLPARILNKLTTLNLLPPMDMFIGRGIYLFPNFRNWPLFNSKSITYIHDVAFKMYPEFIEPKNLAMLNSQIDTYMKRTDTVVTVSDSSERELIEFFPYVKGKTAVVLNSIDSAVFYPRPQEDIDKARQRYNLPEKYFIFLSSIEPRKNILNLLRAYEKLKNNTDTGLLLVGGMGWLNDDVIQKIDELRAEGKWVIRPSRYVPDEDIPALLSGSIALVHPAYHEGFGISPLEAISCGTPAIVADIPVMREVLGDEGVYLNDPNDTDMLCSLMENITKIAPGKRLMIQRAKLFSPDRCYSSLLDILDHLK